jgi:hypothetical protein
LKRHGTRVRFPPPPVFVGRESLAANFALASPTKGLRQGEFEKEDAFYENHENHEEHEGWIKTDKRRR